METTPRGLRKHISIFGKTNGGKSTLFNRLTGQDNSIVSEQAGTTTDPVVKSMELLPFGPVTLVDTAGLDDHTALGKQRMDKTKDFSRRTDLGIFVYDINNFDNREIQQESFFKGEKLDVFTKCDMASPPLIQKLKGLYPDALFISSSNDDDIEDIKGALVKKLQKMEKFEDETLVGDLLPYGSTVVMVVPVDSEAPKGRIILPQVQLIRDCLDHGIKAYVTRETELEHALEDLSQVDLVVTDSQAFHIVNKIVPEEIPLTSFSMLLARQKGNFDLLLDGVNEIKNLHSGDKILVLEGCTHNHTHEDIGRIKIPKLLKKHTKKELTYDFYSGYDMPRELGGFSMAILCGSCMINQKEVLERLDFLYNNNIPATNYGIILAYLNGILPRCSEIFKRQEV